MNVEEQCRGGGEVYPGAAPRVVDGAFVLGEGELYSVLPVAGARLYRRHVAGRQMWRVRGREGQGQVREALRHQAAQQVRRHHAAVVGGHEITHLAPGPPESPWSPHPRSAPVVPPVVSQMEFGVCPSCRECGLRKLERGFGE